MIIPVHNRANLLQTALASLEASGASIEVIVVDDGSALPIEDQVAVPENLPVTFMRQESNGGTFLARRIGFNASSAEFVTFLDGDDALYDGACRAMMDKVTQSDADMGCFGMQKVAPDGKEVWTPLKLPDSGEGPYEHSEKLSLTKRFLSGDHIMDAFFRSQCASVFERRLLERVYDFLGTPRRRLFYMEDTLVAVAALLMSRRCVLSEHRVYRNFLHPNSSSRSEGLEVALELSVQVEIVVSALRRCLGEFGPSGPEGDEFDQALGNFRERAAMMIAMSCLRFPRFSVDPNCIDSIVAAQPPETRQFVRTMLNLSVQMRWQWIHLNRLHEEKREMSEYNTSLKRQLAELRSENERLRKLIGQQN